MKIGIYSDLHLSRTSSILPLHTSESKYTTRLKMIIDTAKWMYDEFENRDVDLIVNCGDTLDSSILNSEEISALKEFYSYSHDTEEIIVVGNHEMKDNDRTFYSSSILNQLSFISIIDKPTKLDKYDISILPYMKYEDISYDLLRSISSNCLFSHIDIKGSSLRGSYISDNGVEPEYLAENFKYTINGHLHTPEVIDTSKNYVCNIGSVSSISFVDSNSYIPSICILDTDNGKIERVNNPHSILFRKKSVKSLTDAISYIKTLNQSYKYVLNLICPYEIRNDVKDLVDSKDFIIASRVTVDNIGNNVCIDTDKVFTDNLITIDVKSEFIKFLTETGNATHGAIDKYLKVINLEL